MNTKTKIVAAAIAIFLAGGVAGGILGASYSKRSLDAGPDQAQIAQNIRSHLKDRASLSEEQLSRIDPIIKKTAALLEATRQETMRKVSFIFTDFHAEIAEPAGLSAEQINKLAEIEREHLARLKLPQTPRTP